MKTVWIYDTELPKCRCGQPAAGCLHPDGWRGIGVQVPDAVFGIFKYLLEDTGHEWLCDTACVFLQKLEELSGAMWDRVIALRVARRK